MSSRYVPREYWDKRLQENWDLTGVGFGGYSPRYNKLLYRFQEGALSRALARAKIRVDGARVLDIGSGIGYWVKWYDDHGAASMTSVDITPTATAALQTLFPKATVIQADIGADELGLPPHDIVNIISVLYHIVDPEAFRRALWNLSASTASGGYLVMSDRLRENELKPADHVHFRSRETYRKGLAEVGFEVQHIQPMHTLMNGGLPSLLSPRVRGLARRMEEALAPALVLMDRIPGISVAANSHILVARKR